MCVYDKLWNARSLQTIFDSVTLKKTWALNPCTSLFYT